MDHLARIADALENIADTLNQIADTLDGHGHEADDENAKPDVVGLTVGAAGESKPVQG